METFASRVLRFYKQLRYTGTLPPGINVMNPYENKEVQRIIRLFYDKFYNDTKRRKLWLGINPGRFGAGVTGVMFTDPRRLKEVCGIDYKGPMSHEPSSVFVYDVIKAYGGPEKFYGDVYINSVFPLALTKTSASGKDLNYNYYDSKALTDLLHDTIISNIWQQLTMGVNSDVCYCLGRGKNFACLEALNRTEHFFEKIVPLEHPRYVMQYKSRQKNKYIDDYLKALAT